MLFLCRTLLRCFAYGIIDFPRNCSMVLLLTCWAKRNLQKPLASFAEMFLPRSVEFNKFLALPPKHQETVAFEQHQYQGNSSCQQGKMGDWRKLLKSPPYWIGTNEQGKKPKSNSQNKRTSPQSHVNLRVTENTFFGKGRQASGYKGSHLAP